MILNLTTAKVSTIFQSAKFIVPQNSDAYGGYIPNPYGRDLGLGYRVRTLPQGFLSPTRGTEGGVKTIEDRWGKYSSVGRFSSSSLRFLSPANGGTEGGVKTIGEDRDERWSLL